MMLPHFTRPLAMALMWSQVSLILGCGSHSDKPHTLEQQESVPSSGLILVARISFKELEKRNGQDPFTKYPGRIRTQDTFGFIGDGDRIYFGWGAQYFKITSQQWESGPPNKFVAQCVSYDGSHIYGYESNTEYSRLRWDIDKTPLKPWKDLRPLDTDNRGRLWSQDGEHFIFVDPSRKYNQWEGKTVFASANNPSQKRVVKDPDGKRSLDIRELLALSGSGHFALVTELSGHGNPYIFFIDLKRGKKLPLMAIFDPTQSDDPSYLGNSESFVLNRDGTWMAGGYKDGSSAFILDTKSKKYIWRKDPEYKTVLTAPNAGKRVLVSTGPGAPAAFSCNDQYLLCEGVIVKASNGEIAFKNLKGKSGKFSPDGRSLVTVDDEAFYIYTLPKESGPIFGIYHKPEPWGPPKTKSVKSASKRP